MADTDSIDAVLDRIESAQDTTPAAPAEPAAPDAAAPAPAAPSAPTPPAAAQDGPPEGATVDQLWKEVKDLRGEAGRYRTERNQLRDESGRFTSAFDGYDPADRDTLLDVARTLRTDPRAAAEWMQSTAQAILAEQQRRADEGERPMTRAEMEQVLADRDQRAQRAALVDEINRQAADLGYKQDSAEYFALLAVANTQTGGDIAKAHDALEASKKSIIDSYLAGKAQEAEQATRPTPPAAAARPADGPVGGIKGAAKAVDEMLARQFGMK